MPPTCLSEGITLSQVFQQTLSGAVKVWKCAGTFPRTLPLIVLEMSRAWLAELTGRDQYRGAVLLEPPAHSVQAKQEGRGLRVWELTLPTRNEDKTLKTEMFWSLGSNLNFFFFEIWFRLQIRFKKLPEFFILDSNLIKCWKIIMTSVKTECANAYNMSAQLD